MTDCPLLLCDGSGLIVPIDWTPTENQVCPCRVGRYPTAVANIGAGLKLAALLEAEAAYYPKRTTDVGDVAHRIRVTLGMIPK